MPTYPLLWHTSHTPLTVGQRECAMARYLGYHAGIHGTGYRRRAKSVPLITGGAVHTGLEEIGKWVLDWQQAHVGEILRDVPAEVTAWAASNAASQYRAQANARGLALGLSEATGTEAIDLLVNEQATLIEGLIWIYALMRLPVMLASYRLLEVEAEEAPVIGCSCGLGEWVGAAPQHAARGCTGIVMQGRPDFLWEDRDSGAIAYEEFKTKAAPNWQWEQSWEHASQLFINMEAASRRLGRPVDTAFVPVLYKGSRKSPYKAQPGTPKFQDSPLCYGYYDAGNAPLRAADWQSAFESTNDMGYTSRLGKTYSKTPIWDASIALPGGRAGASRVETWVREYLQPWQRSRMLSVLGPYPRPQARVELAVKGIWAEESMWRDRVAYLRNSGSLCEPGDEAVDDTIPRSWNCTTYFSRCQFYSVCMREPGWDNLATHPDFQIRTPHHSTELDACKAGGVEFPAGDFEADADGGEE